MVQVCRERKEGKDPDMSVLLGLRSKFNPSLDLSLNKTDTVGSRKVSRP